MLIQSNHACNLLTKMHIWYNNIAGKFWMIAFEFGRWMDRNNLGLQTTILVSITIGAGK